jgi:hypothetical protein
LYTEENDPSPILDNTLKLFKGENYFIGDAKVPIEVTVPTISSIYGIYF